ncbi:MAG: ABC-F type ribosomal protection protein [Bacillaceae bacterium]|nr:ABC-F type ribosomal protection protein [Bacillaceae bacterium]
MMLLEAIHMKLYAKERLLIEIEQLQIHKRDRIGLVGKNGNGKTTLLEVLAGRRTPDLGHVHSFVRRELLPQLKQTDTSKSGGEVTQQYINQALNSDPDILFADEPTTHLDTSHIEWLEKKLSNWQGAFVIVSHDREFLDTVCTTIWEIDEGQIKEYKGNYSDYVAQKKLKTQQHHLAYEKFQKKKRQLEDAISQKTKKAQRATKAPKKVSSSEARITGAKPYFAKKQKKLDQTANALKTRVELLEKVEKPKDVTPIKMTLPNEETFKGRIILQAKDVKGSAGDRLLWQEASFHVRGGDKLAIIGVNGSGKTTLIQKMLNQAEGFTHFKAMKVGYFSQNLNLLDTEKTIIENVSTSTIQDETFVRTVLARLHFYREDVFKPVSVLSGGERVKVALAKLFVSDSNTLILDEPTNFLDIEAVTALEGLLKEYEGTVIFVSHDRRFIRQVATRILEIKEKTLVRFDGAYDDYIDHKPQEKRNHAEDERLILETKISEVLSLLSIEPTDALEQQFQHLLAEKRKLQ